MHENKELQCQSNSSMQHYECIALCKDIKSKWNMTLIMVDKQQPSCNLLNVIKWQWIKDDTFKKECKYIKQQWKQHNVSQSPERPILCQISSLMYPKIQWRQVTMNVLHPCCEWPPQWSPPCTVVTIKDEYWTKLMYGCDGSLGLSSNFYQWYFFPISVTSLVWRCMQLSTASQWRKPLPGAAHADICTHR